MTSQNRIRQSLTFILLAGLLAALWFPFRAFVWGPYQARRTMLSLPAVPPGITMADMGMPQTDS
ncbi:MAG: hypothetical protein WBX38_13060, partial [Candidatus Sulfotelmatobacter sp.]